MYCTELCPLRFSYRPPSYIIGYLTHTFTTSRPIVFRAVKLTQDSNTNDRPVQAKDQFQSISCSKKAETPVRVGCWISQPRSRAGRLGRAHRALRLSGLAVNSVVLV